MLLVVRSEIIIDHWGLRRIDILIIGGVDVSDYVETGSLEIKTEAETRSIVDLDGTTHAVKIRKTKEFGASLGLVPETLINSLDTAIDSAAIVVTVNGEQNTYTEVSLSRSDVYADDTGIYWDASVSGVKM